MTTVRVVVVDESGHPLVGVTVAAYSLANFPLINAYAITDEAGSVTLTTDGPSFYDAFDRRGISFRDRSYYGKVQIQIVSFGNNMNADYVVDKSGSGTHLTLFGSTGALQAALAAGTAAFIWLCTTHTETVATQEVLPAFAANQQIIVGSGTRERAVISVTLASSTPLITIAGSNGASSSLSFKSFRFTRISGTGALVGPAAGGPAIIPLEFENVDFKNSGSTFDALVGGSLLTAMTTSTLTVRGCTGDGVLVIQQLGATSASLGAFIMEDCTMTLEGVNRHSSSTSVDWGMSGGGVIIRNNILTITNKLYLRNYDMTFFHIDNNVIFHTGAAVCIQTGNVQTGSNVHVCNNSYQATAVGASFMLVGSATSNIKNVIVTGNSLDGPGSGTAISTLLLNTGALPDQIILAPNVYRDWTTNFDGTAGGATDDFTDVNPDGTSALAAPNAADYLIGTADTRLPNAFVVGITPGGELGGTWASPTVDATHGTAGGSHHPESHASRHAQAGADVLDVASLGSGGAANTFVATADGAGGVDWLAGSGGGGGAAIIPFLHDSLVTEWTNQPAALTELFGTTINRTKINLTAVTSVTFVVNVQVAGVAGAALRVQYSTDEAIWNYLDGAAGPSVAIDVTGVEVATVSLVAGAKADVFLRVVGINGDAAADPAFGSIALIAGGASGGGAPTGAKYVVTEAHSGLSAEMVLPYLANYNPDLPPVSPSAYDDEFDNDSLDVKWTSTGTPDILSETAYHGFLKVADNDVAECGVYESYVPGAAAFTIVCKVNFGLSNNESWAGLKIMDSTGATSASYCLIWRRTAPTMNAAIGPAAGTAVSVGGPTAGVAYLRLTRDAGSAWLGYWSANGISWQVIGAVTNATTVGRIYLMINSGSSTNETQAHFEWIRVFTTETEIIGRIP